MNVLDKKTLNLFAELAEDGASINNVGSKNAFQKIMISKGNLPEEENYSKEDLLKADQNTKNLAIKIINEQERNFSEMVIKTAKEKMLNGNGTLPVGLMCLAWEIISKNTKDATAQLGNKSEILEFAMCSKTPQTILPLITERLK